MQGGHSSTIELTALRKPFIFFPIEGHSEQENVAQRVARHRAGFRMALSETSPSVLAEEIVARINTKPDYSQVSTAGARNAARLINQLLLAPQ